ncbi:MAG: hypothetical protein C3F13_06575 [Anaerolineales bacterium]|nr:MAG: hypothetical protein C3F13_06575 [Anaerolineales bacterium]
MTINQKNLLIDIGHPAHVHLFRHAIHHWQDRGYQITITIRDKDLTKQLLDLYGFHYAVASVARHSTPGLAIELLEHDWGVYKAAKKTNSYLLMGTSVAISHAARLLGAKSMVFNEDDKAAVPTFVRLAYPLADAIVTPDCLHEDYGHRHIKYRGYQKLAYLHPNEFTPNPKVLSKLGVSMGEPYFLLRFVALNAAHDKGQVGLSQSVRRRILDTLLAHGRVFITSERTLPDEFEPYRFPISPVDMHDALAFAKLLVSDSQTMTAEAAILGTPAIRCNSFVGRISYLEELEHRYELTYGFLPSDSEKMLSSVEKLITLPNIKETWRERREKMLSEKIDVTSWMVKLVEDFGQTKLS